jgi:predicted dehydrogenase
LVKNPAVAAACITTPSGAHAEAAVPFLEAGKAVLCEKPMEISLEALDRILEAAERGGGLLAGVFQSRFGRGAQVLKAAIEAGRFGRLTLCSA